MKSKLSIIAALALSLPMAIQAQITVDLGVTNIAADFVKLQQDAGLAINQDESQGTEFGKSGFDIAFEITDGTDFTYSPVANFADFDPVDGTSLEHAALQGIEPAIAFNRTDNNALLSTGDLKIGFDDTRQGSGLFVEDVTGDFGFPVFDFATPDPADFTAAENDLFVESDLLFTPEFASFLQNEGLASTDLTGDTVGNGQVDAVPEPAMIGGIFGAVALGFALLRRRRRGLS